MPRRSRFTPDELRDRVRQQKREFFQKRVARGLCRRCATPWAGPTVNCLACRRVISAQEQARKQQKGDAIE